MKLKTKFACAVASLSLIVSATVWPVCSARLADDDAYAAPLSSDCAAGKPYCYDNPVHLSSLINTPGFEGKPALSADGLEL